MLSFSARVLRPCACILYFFSISNAERFDGSSPRVLTASNYRLPLTFEKSEGQAPGGIHFLGRARNYNLALTASETLFQCTGKHPAHLRMRLAGAISQSTLEGE